MEELGLGPREVPVPTVFKHSKFKENHQVSEIVGREESRKLPRLVA